MTGIRVRRVGPPALSLSLVAAALWLGLEAAAEQGGGAPDDTEARYAGEFRYAESLDHGRAIVRGALGKAIDSLNPILRPIARNRLAASDPLIRTIIIALPERRISVTLVGQKRATFATRPGVPEKVRNPDGREVDLTQRFVEGSLEQVFVGPKGRSRSRYTLLRDGKRLAAETTITGEGLDEPIAYRLTYARHP